MLSLIYIDDLMCTESLWILNTHVFVLFKLTYFCNIFFYLFTWYNLRLPYQLSELNLFNISQSHTQLAGRTHWCGCLFFLINLLLTYLLLSSEKYALTCVSFNPKVLEQFGRNAKNPVDGDTLVQLALDYIEHEHKVKVSRSYTVLPANTTLKGV